MKNKTKQVCIFLKEKSTNEFIEGQIKENQSCFFSVFLFINVK